MRILEREAGRCIAHATAPARELSRVVLWLGGTPHTGALLAPVVAAAARVGRDVVSVTRPGYGGTPRRSRHTVADAADDAVQIMALLELEDVIIAGFSGGGPHALAAAAARPGETTAVLTFGSPAPFDGAAAWFSGMADPTALRAATHGLAARTAHPDVFEPSTFIACDYAALETEWRDLAADVEAAELYGRSGAVDDDVAFTRPWGFSLSDCTSPVRLAHGDSDRVIPASHALALSERLPNATVAIYPGDGHVSVLRHLASEMGSIE